MRKYLPIVLILLSCATTLMAQPRMMTYQAVVRNANNELVINQQIGIRISIIEDNANGPIAYAETHTTQTNANALFSIVIGTGTKLLVNNMSDIKWGIHNHYMRIEIDPAGGTNYTITGTQQLLSVPYSLYSDKSKYVDTALYASNANTANYSTYTDSSLYSYTALYSTYADSSWVAIYAGNAIYADTTLYAHNSNHTIYADTALYLMNAQNSDTAKFAYNADTANYALNATAANSSNNSITSTYSDTAHYAHYAHNSQNASNAVNAVYADSVNYNNLINKPMGTNRGDILYWEPNDTSWHIIPAGNAGETLTMDTNNIPYWHSNNITLPNVVTDSVIKVTATTAMTVGTVVNDGGSTFVFSGSCWGTTPNPTTSDFHTLDGLVKGPFTSNITGLSHGTTYHVRTFATNNAGTVYGNQITFKTPTYPTVTTTAASNISVTTATSGGNVTDDGGATVTARGVCWSDTTNSPTIANSHTVDGIGTGNFTSNITGLTANTKYYLRAYATNSIGTIYGDTISLTTLGLPPTVITTAASNITGTTAVSGGNVINSGGSPVTARGVCWNTIGNPTIYDNITTNGTGTGTYTSNLNNLSGTTTYYLRAYATNSSGTSYGETISFITSFNCGSSKVKDYDNNEYNTVLIGSQCWMKENLRTTHYANGNTITIENASTHTAIAYAYHSNGNASNDTLYGLLYNLYATCLGNTSNSNPSGIQGVCPNGWHVPSQAEWTELTDYVSSQPQYHCGGNSTYITKSLSSTIGWTSTSTNTCAVSNTPSDNNKTGFNAMPAGSYNGTYDGFGSNASFWCSSSNIAYLIFYHFPSILSSGVNTFQGHSVRCIKD